MRTETETLTMEQLQDFDQVYKKYFNMVAATISKFRITDAAADDILQDTFIQAWQNLSSLRDPKAFRGWLVTIARNNCLKTIKKRKPTISIAGTDDLSSESEEAEIVLIADDIHASLHFEHSIELLRELIDHHKGEPRATVAKLFYLENKAIKEIMAELDMKQNTVLSHLRRFRLIVSKAMVELIEENDLVF